MHRVLRPGGRLVIVDQSIPEDDLVDQCMNKLDYYHDESHVRQYRPSEWEQMLEDLVFVVEEVQPGIKHRPLTSLAEGVSPENRHKIETVLAALDDQQRQAMKLVEVEGQLFLNHWYVMLSASRC